MKPQEPTDEELMAAYVTGDFQAFEVLYRRHSARIYSFLQRRIEKREELDEVFQQVLTKFHQSRHKYDPSYPILQWFFVISKSILLDHWRQSKRTRENVGLDTIPDLADLNSPLIETALIERNSAENALSSLKEEQKQAIEWRIQDELPYEEIAKRLGKSPEGARQTVSRALRKLRQSIEGSSRSEPRKGGLK